MTVCLKTLKEKVKMKLTKNKSVYVVKFNNGNTKIGISSDVKNRINYLCSEYKSCVKNLFYTENFKGIKSKNIEQQILYNFREYRIGNSELLKLDFWVVVEKVKLYSIRDYETIKDYLDCGDEFLPITHLVSIINGERIIKNKPLFNLSTWIESNNVFIKSIIEKFGKAIEKKSGGYTYAHKYIFTDIAISAGGLTKIQALEFIGGFK